MKDLIKNPNALMIGAGIVAFAVTTYILNSKSKSTTEKKSNATGCGCGGSSNFGGCGCGA